MWAVRVDWAGVYGTGGAGDHVTALRPWRCGAGVRVSFVKHSNNGLLLRATHWQFRRGKISKCGSPIGPELTDTAPIVPHLSIKDAIALA